MSTKRDFEEFLKRSESLDEEEKRIDWNKRKEEWLKDVDEFYAMIQGFLHDYIDQGKVAITFKPRPLHEEPIGSYETRQLCLRITNKTIVFLPVGTILIGASGRIDMGLEGGAEKVRFVLVDKDLTGIAARKLMVKPSEKIEKAERKVILAWKIATPPPSIEYIDLDEETFFDALMAVMNE